MLDIYPDKAQYLTGETVDITILSDLIEYKTITIRLFHLAVLLKEWKVTVTKTQQHEKIGSFPGSFGGYGIEVFSDNGSFLAGTAFDVVEDAGMSLRYGFLSDFTAKDGENHFDVENIRKYHINMVQFYDWSFKHDELVADTPDYEDMMGKKINKAAVLSKINACKKYGMMPIAYGAVYAASKDYFENHPEEAYYNSSGSPFCFINTFYIMNISSDSPWHSKIIHEYCDAVKRMGFSGIHMDTYGFPKTAFSHLKGEVMRKELAYEFKPLINHTCDALSRILPDPYLIFNNVGNWPVKTVADASLKALYIEVWSPYERYHHIKEIIANAKERNPLLPVILAAYLAPFRLEDSTSAGYAAYLLTAAIVTCGGYHLLLGEENAVLTQGYYSDYSYLTPEQAKTMRDYYDFMIRYLNLFYDNELTDVSMTHIGFDNDEYRCEFDHFSTYGEAGKVWVTVREKEDLKTISLINLCGVTDDYWNKGKEEPALQDNLTFCVQTDVPVKGIFAASPDEGCSSAPIPYTVHKTNKGCLIRFTVCSLILWKLIYIQF